MYRALSFYQQWHSGTDSTAEIITTFSKLKLDWKDFPIAYRQNLKLEHLKNVNKMLLV